MKIAVFTHSEGDDNYGQILQCFALQKHLISMGHDAALAQYSSDGDVVRKRFHALKNLLRRLFRAVSPRRRAQYRVMERIVALRRSNAEKNKERRFGEFKRDHICKCAEYATYREVLANPPEADAYIVGSDQVWNILLDEPSSCIWYLDFGPERVRRLSYAASIGRRLKRSELSKFGDRLRKLNAISVRETTALEECRLAGCQSAQVVVDPTLLAGVDLYLPFITHSPLNRRYLFCYYLNIDSSDALAWPQIEEYMKREKFDLVSVSSSGYLPADDLIPGHENKLLTIPEWLNCIYHAEAVVTTSFHGIAFAVLMHRPFVALPLKGAYSAGNVRIESLLGSLGLVDRILCNDETISNILAKPIDWVDVDKRLSILRTSSEKFLKDALS